MRKWTRRAFVTTGVLAGGTLAIGVGIRPGNRARKVADAVSVDNETLVNIWLKIAADNSVTVIVPHAEMGQGVHTTLAMMLADELDADWEQVRMMEAPAHEEYANYALARGYVAGDRDFPAFFLPTVDGFFLTATKMMSLQITGGSTSTPYTGQLAMRLRVTVDGLDIDLLLALRQPLHRWPALLRVLPAPPQGPCCSRRRRKNGTSTYRS